MCGGPSSTTCATRWARRPASKRSGSRATGVRAWLPALRRERGSSLLSSLVEVVIIVGTAFILALLIQQFVVKPFYIPSESMENTLLKGDRVLVNRFIYRFTDPKPGDLSLIHISEPTR